MKATIITFSPTGNTLKVAKSLEKKLLQQQVKVQLIDITGNEKIFKEGKYLEYLNKEVKEHDVLCIGSPVYAHHISFYVKNLIKNLPKPNKKWGKMVVPFVTYGGVSSGIALLESAKLFKKSGRTPVLAMKINAEHSFNSVEQVTIELNKGLPGKEEEKIIDALANKIIQLEESGQEVSNKQDIISELNYMSLREKLQAQTISREKFWQKYLYPKVSINNDICIKCGKCVDNCPVLRIKMTESGPMIPKKSAICVHCMSCLVNCPTGAISTNSNWKIYNKSLTKASEGKGIICSNEQPKSAVYGN